MISANELNQNKNLTAVQLRLKYKFYTGREHPSFPKSNWINCVFDHETPLGYWEWVEESIQISLEKLNRGT